MKRLSAALATTVALLAPPALADVVPPPPAELSATPDGAALYEASCAKCHGTDGKGTTKIGEKFRADGKRMPDLVASKLDQVKTRSAIADGIAGTAMKGYASKLSAAEIDALTAYTTKLRR
jgi:cytochrome c oxidase cbb3-type subunit 3